MLRKMTLVGGAAAAIAVAFTLVPPPAKAEVTLRAVSAFPRTQLMTRAFVNFVNAVNKEGKGLVQIRYLGGPEVANPREQPVGLRKGLFDIIYGPTGYYLGLFPEGDMFYGKNTPLDRRANGFTTQIDKAFREKLGAHYLAQLIGSIGVNLFLRQKPKLRADGMPDLTGLKIRSSPSYRDFVKALGGTPVVMRGMGEVYTALQRGVVDGTGSPLVQVRDVKIEEYVKVGVVPPMFMTTMVAIVDAKKFDAMPKKARDLLERTAIRFEKETFESAEADIKRERAALEKKGVEFMVLTGAAREKWLDTFLKTPWTRLRSYKGKISVNIDQMQKLASESR